jgi:hypothetical protein
VTSTQQPSKRARRRKRREEPLPPYDGPDAVAPPLRWARRLTPLRFGRRRVRLSMDGGWLTLLRQPALGSERVVVRAPAAEFHSLAPSRSGRGLHLWHGDRVFRLVGKSSAKTGGADTPAFGNDPVSAVLAVILLPVYLLAVVAARNEQVASERKNVATTLRWLGPVVGHPPPGTQVRPPLPGGWLAAGRWTLRLAVVAALVAALIAVL